jgi:hypothetical protein
MARYQTHRGVLRAPLAPTEPTRRRLLAGLACCIACLAGLPATAETPPFRANPYSATSSDAARADAVKNLPMEKFSPQQQAKVAKVLQEAKIFRRMPLRVIQCDPDLYLFLVRHPDVVVNIWEVLGVSEMQLSQTGPDRFRLVDGQGTSADLRFIYKAHDQHIIYVEGAYDGPLFIKPVRGNGLMILRTGYVREPDGRYYITSRLDTFTHLQPEGAELITKTFQPLVGKVADTNFIQTVAFVGSLSRTAELNLRGVQRLATRLLKVDAQVRRQFAELAQTVAARAIHLTEHQDAEQTEAPPRDDTAARHVLPHSSAATTR